MTAEWSGDWDWLQSKRREAKLILLQSKGIHGQRDARLLDLWLRYGRRLDGAAFKDKATMPWLKDEKSMQSALRRIILKLRKHFGIPLELPVITTEVVRNRARGGKNWDL